jgi:hypothetical protein
MRPHLDPKWRRAGGFTLLEMIMAMLVLVLLVGAIFAIVGGTTQLADEMARALERDAKRHSFAQFCERMFRTLPGTAQVRLRVKQEGNFYTGELALKNAPSPVGATGANGMTTLRTEQSPDGYLRVLLEMLTNEESDARELGKGNAPKQQLVLLEGVAKCEWKFFNIQSNEWEPVWNENLSFAPGSASEAPAPPATPPGAQPPANPPPATVPTAGPLARRPGLVELTLAIGADASQRFVFWIPPASLPGAPVAGSAPAPTPAPPSPQDPANNPPPVPTLPK